MTEDSILIRAERLVKGDVVLAHCTDRAGLTD